MYAIKIKHKTEQRWLFLAPDYSETRLAIKAIAISSQEKAASTCEQLQKINPDFDFKVVHL